LEKIEKPLESIEEARKVLDISEKIKTGIIYQNQSVPVFYDRLENRKERDSELVDEVKQYDISKLLDYLD
jgi:hypothetical protein